MTLDEKVEEGLAMARTYANRGKVSLMDIALDFAREDAEKAGYDITDQIKEIEDIGYKKAIHNALGGARIHAERGERPSMYTALDSAKDCAAKVGLDISREIKEIEELGYMNANPNTLSDAKKHAEQGDVSLMEQSPDPTADYAAGIGQDITEQITEINKRKYQKAIRKGLHKELKSAKRFAEEGRIPAMNIALDFARRYAEEAGQDITWKIKEITDLGYHNTLARRILRDYKAR